MQFLGPRRHVEAFMQASDCLICPSVWAEAVGLVNLEAMASGLPVIASRIGGIPEYVEDGRTGFLFAPGDHRELVGCLNRLLSDQPGRQAMSQNARLPPSTVFGRKADWRLPEPLWSRCRDRMTDGTDFEIARDADPIRRRPLSWLLVGFVLFGQPCDARLRRDPSHELTKTESWWLASPTGPLLSRQPQWRIIL